MCGVVAIYHPHGCVSLETVARATASLYHRGPDGQRHWIAPHGRVGLGHARLSILGGQPTDTLYEGIAQVPPGHYLLAGPSGYELHRYWDFDYPRADCGAPARSDASWAEELGATLENAVRLRLRGRRTGGLLPERRPRLLQRARPRRPARPVLTDTVYRRQKHPFLSPPATLNPEDRLHHMVQDALRGSALQRLPFFDQGRVVRMLDRLPSLPLGEQVAVDQILMILTSACVLGSGSRWRREAGARIG